MACGCQRKRKNLDYIRNLAVKYSKIQNESVQIYSEIVQDLEGEQLIYKFEPVNKERVNIIEIINP